METVFVVIEIDHDYYAAPTEVHGVRSTRKLAEQLVKELESKFIIQHAIDNATNAKMHEWYSTHDPKNSPAILPEIPKPAFRQDMSGSQRYQRAHVQRMQEWRTANEPIISHNKSIKENYMNTGSSVRKEIQDNFKKIITLDNYLEFSKEINVSDYKISFEIEETTFL